MHSRTVEQVRSWDSRPFDGGLAALSALSNEGHTGAVTAADTWLFMLNGRVIGVVEGEIEDFEAAGTVYSTPADGLPLLFAMQERGGRTRAKYFTEDTSLQEADQTLSAANFTGYVELSENVLSGDYYLVYYGGTRREVAFVGQSERVETGEAAYELATDEVGLYEVKDVSLTITEIPEPAQATAAAPAGEAAGSTQAGDEADSPAAGDQAAESNADRAPPTESPGDPDQSAAAPSSPDESAESRSDAQSRAADASPASVDSATDSPDSGTPATSSNAGSSAENASAPSSPQSGSSTSSRQAPNDQSAADTTSRTAETGPKNRQQRTAEAGQRPRAGAGTQDAGTETKTGDGSSETAGGSPESASSEAAALERRFQEEAEWRQTRAIPALDPDDTHSTDDEPDQPSPAEQAPEPTERSQAPTPETGRSNQATSQQAPRTRAEKLKVAVKKREERIEELQSRIEALETEREDLRSDLEAAQSARESLESDLEALREERDELATRVEALEAGAEASSSAETIAADTALAGTNLFVRYDSKGEPTLEALGEADPDAIDANLRLEHHTQFETDAVTVEGSSYRDFLESTGTFAVLSWLLREFPYELLATDNQSAMAELFEAISAIDRIELEGDVTVDAEEGRTETFSFVLRDRMGNPLIVGEYDDSRDAVRESKLQALLTGAEAVAGVSDQFSGAFYVTKSFFEPDALELAENSAASGGLFSRGEKASYVSPADGTGFHLALVEDRSQSFHVTVPKL